MNLPKKIKSDLRSFNLVHSRSSRLGGKNLKFINNNGTTVYLKIGNGIAAESLIQESVALQWLEHSQVTIPKVLNYFKDKRDGNVYLLLSAIEGVAAYSASEMPTTEILHIVAEALKQFHAINIKSSENLRTLDDDLSHIQACIMRNVLNKKSFQDANSGKSPQEIFEYLYKMRQIFSSDVLVHGDYCLPNILITDSRYGFIDVGNCGPGDRYKDFSAMEVSISRNFGKDWIDTFYKYYDKRIKRNLMKVKYYQLIDQFEYHLDIHKYLQLRR